MKNELFLVVCYFLQNKSLMKIVIKIGENPNERRPRRKYFFLCEILPEKEEEKP